IKPLRAGNVGYLHQHMRVVGRTGGRLGLGHRIHVQAFRSSPITPASAPFSFGTSWMITGRLVGLAPACWHIAAGISRTSPFLCPGVRPVHICTVTTGMSLLLRKDFLDSLPDAAPLAGADRHRRPAAEPTAPDRRQAEPLGGIEIDAARWRRKVDDQRR